MQDDSNMKNSSELENARAAILTAEQVLKR